jgi:class 3 adenylate cyclase
MPTSSRHLTEIYDRHNRTCNALLVFVDVESYSKRRTLCQLSVIDALTKDLTDALSEVAREHLTYSQTNDLNFKTDVITIPTGDGAAIVFTFEGLPTIHLDLALALLRQAQQRRTSTPCPSFDTAGWCNCHASYNLRIGVSEGKVILFHDTNDNWNVAGGTINIASRVMSLADRNQILVSADAYRQVVDLVDDPTFASHFVEFPDVEIKHAEKIVVYQYVGKKEDYVNRMPPEGIVTKQRLQASLQVLKGGLPFPDFDTLRDLGPKGVVEFVETFAGVIDKMQKLAGNEGQSQQPARVLKLKSPSQEPETPDQK